QLHGMPELGNLAPPIMRTAAGLHADQTRRQLGEEGQHLLASELPGNDNLALGIDAVDLEYLLCKVEPDGGNCSHGRPSLVIRLQQSLSGPWMPCEAPPPSSRMARSATDRLVLDRREHGGTLRRLGAKPPNRPNSRDPGGATTAGECGQHGDHY